MKTYLAIDLKSYYASAECVARQLDPLTTNLVVADESRTEKTICLAVSPSLKAYGIPGRARLFEVIQKIQKVNSRRLQAAIRNRTALTKNGLPSLSSPSFDAEAIARDPLLEVSYLVAPPRMAYYMELSAQIYSVYLNYLLHVPFILRVLTLILLIIVLARPQTTNSWQNSEVEGIDIMLAVDVSTSMLAEDLKPNRLEAAKDVAATFINGRPNDNIGITLFAGESFTQCPLTVDHSVLLNLIKDVKCGLIEDGTAVGMGIANAVTRLKNSKAKSKVIILLTDGTNNRGDISPLTAAEIAKSFGIRVYTIGVGTNGMAPYPYPVGGTVQYVNLPVEIDEKTLTQIAGITDGNYFRATSNSKLEEVYKEIDKLEKTKLPKSE